MNVKNEHLYSLGIFLFANSLYAGTMGPVSTGFDKDRVYYGGEAIYGNIESGLTTKAYARTFDTINGATTTHDYSNTYLPSASNGWGFRVIAGYHLDSSSPHDLEASYLYLNRNSSSQISAPSLKTDLVVTEPTTFAGTASINATAFQSNYSQYQTLQINNITRQVWTWFPSVEHSYIYGLRGALIKEGIAAYYSSANSTRFNNMSYSNELYGIGPQIGNALKWNVMEHFQIGGDILAGLVFGNGQARYTDSNYSNTGVPPSTPFEQSQSNIFGALLFSGQIYAGFNYLVKDEQVLRIDGGVSGDAYIPSVANNTFTATREFKASNSYVFRDIFIRLVYKA